MSTSMKHRHKWKWIVKGYMKECSLSQEEFSRLAELGHHPCEEHQKNIDRQAEREYFEAVDRGDKETAEGIRNSPFTWFGKTGR